MTALSDQWQQVIWRSVVLPKSIEIKSLYTGLFAPNHHIWLAQGLSARKILLTTHQIWSLFADAGQLFMTLHLGQMMAFSCHGP